MKPKAINKTSQKIMETLTDGLDKPGDNHVFDAHNYTKKWDGGIMAAHVEHIGYMKNYPMYSVAHYYKQNGDMMRDPDMVFIKHPTGFIPVSFHQDNMGIYQESLWYDDGFRMNPIGQRDHTSFANMWLKNIKEQQEL